METKRNDLHGDVLVPKSLLEILEIAIDINDLRGRNIYFWRGQSNIDWAVDSSAFRRLRLTKNIPSESDLIFYEECLLEQAIHRNYNYNSGIYLCEMDLLSLLQHHGAATRLLDFSLNFLIALWFTCNENLDRDGYLLGIHCKEVAGYECNLEFTTYKECTTDLMKIDYPLVWDASKVTSRISAQSSLFLYSKISNKSSGSFCVPEKNNGTKKVLIKSSLKKTILEHLEKTFDIRHHTIFPDLDGFCGANSYGKPTSNMYKW